MSSTPIPAQGAPAVVARPTSRSWLRPVAMVIALALSITTLGRLGLIAWQWGRVEATGGLGFILLQGLRFDLVTVVWFLGPAIVSTPLLLALPLTARVWPRLLLGWSMVVLGALTFMELVTPSYVAEYDMRPQLLFVEYFGRPKEVASMLWSAYKLPLFAVALVLALLLTASWRVLRATFAGMKPVPVLSAVLVTPAVLLTAVLLERSTLDHRPVNPSTAAFSSDPLVNMLALNSSYTTLYALYELRHEERRFAYGDVDSASVIAAVRASMGLAPDDFPSLEIPTLHWQEATRRYERPKNLVIVLEESLGSEFVGRMGGPPLTPNLDRLADEGIWFEQLYATGTRSVRGIEAVVSGFLPTTSRSVVKLGRSQRDFFTLGELLRRAGYETSFLYGGEAQFDNMGRFFANNGFETIVDKHGYVEPAYSGSWGVSDEDLFDLAADRFASRADDRPFFSLIFTTSNHSPFGYPEGRIELFEQPAGTVNNAVRYADYALGTFFDRVRSSDYWDDTVFLVVADHNSRVFGSELVPIERFHIPGLVLGGGIDSQVVERVSSQIDLLPTLLSLIGVSAEHPAVGLDLTRPDIGAIAGRAVMQYGTNQAYLEEDRVVVLTKGFRPRQFVYDGGSLTEVEGDPTFVDKAVHLAAWPWLAYTEGYYRLPGTQADSLISSPERLPLTEDRRSNRAGAASGGGVSSLGAEG